MILLLLLTYVVLLVVVCANEETTITTITATTTRDLAYINHHEVYNCYYIYHILIKNKNNHRS